MTSSSSYVDTLPDYSATPRAAVPEAFKWRIADLYPDEAAWRAALADLKARIPGLEPLGQAWTTSAQAMGDFLERLEQVNILGSRLSHYASLQADMDLGDTRYQTMKGEIQSVLVDLGARLAFMDPELLELGEAKVEAYIQADPRLVPHRDVFRVDAGNAYTLAFDVPVDDAAVGTVWTGAALQGSPLAFLGRQLRDGDAGRP